MKKQTTTLTSLTKEQLETLTTQVKETLATNLAGHKPFGSIDLWNVRRRSRSLVSRRSFF